MAVSPVWRPFRVHYRAMRTPLWVATGACALALIPSSAAGFFEAFSRLADEIKKIEQSSPESVDKTVQDLESTSFKDVKKDEWFYRYVTPVARWGIVSGYKDAQGKATGQFGAGNTVTVAEILKMALKAAQVDESTCKGTPALAQARDHWAKAFVVCAEQKKMRLLKSKPDLNRAALRGEVLSIIFDAFGDTVPPLFAPFKDAVGHTFEADIAYAAALRMVSGDKDATGNPTGTFRPNAAVNRAEAAKIIYERLRVEVMGEKK